MKKLSIITGLILGCVSFAAAFEWAVQSGSYYCWPTGMAVDPDGTVYVTGGFGGYFNAGGKQIKVKSAKPALMDFYLAAYDSDGEFLWAATGGGAGADCGTEVAVGEDGIYVCGYYEKEADISGEEVSGTGLFSHFVAKYSFKGKLLWIQTATDTENMWPKDIALDKDGSAYAVGFFKGGAVFGKSKLKKVMEKNSYVVKYTSGGEQEWVKQMSGGTDFLTGIYEKSIEVSPDGNIYICGYMIGEVLFEKFKYKTSITKFSKNEWLYNYEMFIAKYEPDGKFVWMKSAGVDLFPEGFDIDKDGYIYVSGYFKGILSGKDIGKASVGGITIQGIVSKDETVEEDIFAAKLDPECKGIWAKTFGGQSYDRAFDINVAPNGDVAITGNYANEAKFDSKQVKVKNSAGLNWDVYICILDKNGKVKNIWSCGGDKTDIGDSVEYSESGELYALGLYGSTADFDGDELTPPDKLSDMYILKVK
ncbi:MAG: hypothetical protein A2Y33_12210 [Spirochaetes bacterium GWF1_51_8]|nr:MAG: hypothetical protein A2Y33_12210 [Spirochaetes bacterium GWF1_51_8]